MTKFSTKIVLIITMMLPTYLMAADDSKPTDDTIPPPPKLTRIPPSLSLTDPFNGLMQKLFSLNITGNVEPWRRTILRYHHQGMLLGTEQGTLKELRDRILQEDLPVCLTAMVNRAFDYLLLRGPSATELITPASYRGFPPSPNSLGFISPLSLAALDSPVAPLLNYGRGDLLLRRRPVTPFPQVVLPRVVSARIITDHLKTFIAGQDEAVASLSFLAHRFLCNKRLIDAEKLPASRPAHCILTGPTGCGKSESLRRLGQFSGVPILHINARSLTDEGFKGTNFSQVVGNFCKSHSMPRVAIVAIDEIDKLASGDDDIKNFGLAIQQVLLSCLDGNPVAEDKVSYDVSNWWFVGTGAFSGLKGLHDSDGERATTARTHADVIAAGLNLNLLDDFNQSSHLVVTQHKP